jgi:hypothetical protein
MAIAPRSISGTGGIIKPSAIREEIASSNLRSILTGRSIQTLRPSVSVTSVSPVTRPASPITDVPVISVQPRPMDPDVVQSVLQAEKQNVALSMNVSTGQVKSSPVIPTVIPSAPTSSFAAVENRPSSTVADSVYYTLGDISNNTQALDEVIVSPSKKSYLPYLVFGVCLLFLFKK